MSIESSTIISINAHNNRRLTNFTLLSDSVKNTNLQGFSYPRNTPNQHVS